MRSAIGRALLAAELAHVASGPASRLRPGVLARRPQRRRASASQYRAGILLAAGDPVAGQHGWRAQFERANNMTDTLAALGVLCLVPGPAREEALDRFYETFRTDALVVDKWFALQASIPEATTLDRVAPQLMNHPAFSVANAQPGLFPYRFVRRQPDAVQPGRRRRATPSCPRSS